jgi:hypothetical protein
VISGDADPPGQAEQNGSSGAQRRRETTPRAGTSGRALRACSDGELRGGFGAVLAGTAARCAWIRSAMSQGAGVPPTKGHRGTVLRMDGGAP